MQRCLELAKNGLGSVAPNPMVGSVVVYNDVIIGEGWHQQYGQAHAEVNAINSVKDKRLLKEATLYVSLEPCAHQGKTPPCADLIVENKIPNVVIACIDSYAEVAGKGIEKLEKAGVNVTVDILKDEAKYLNRRFFTFHEHKRPYIILKWAETKDGYIDINRNAASATGVNWITGTHTNTLVHKWRSEEAAILVGTRTAINDNPSLTTRKWPGKNPLRILIDKDFKVSTQNNMYDNSTATWVVNSLKDETSGNIHFKKMGMGEALIPQLMNELYKNNIQSIIIEGGKTVLENFIKSDLWDEARVLIGNKYFEEGLEAPKLHKTPVSTTLFAGDTITIYHNN